MMKSRPFTLILFALISLPLVLDDMPPTGVLLARLDAATHGAWPILAGLALLLSGALVVRSSRRGDLEL